jgi:hypothetical protein
MKPLNLTKLAVTIAFVASSPLVTTPAFAENVKAWSGAGTDDNWTTDANWNAFGGGAPANDGTFDVWVSWFGNTRTSPVVDVAYLVNSVFLPNGVPNPVTLSGQALTIDFDAPGSTGSTGSIEIQGNGTLIFNNAVNILAATNPLVGNNGSSMQFNGALAASATNSVTMLKSSQTGTSFNDFTIGSSGSFTGSELQVISSASGLGFQGGTTLHLNNNTALVDTLTLQLIESSSVFNDAAKIDLNFLGAETVAALFINGTPQAAGAYGATGSGATNIDDVHFFGTGQLLVVPEPSSALLLLLGTAGVLGFARRRVI